MFLVVLDTRPYYSNCSYYSYLHMKKRMKEMMQRMLMMTAIPTKTVAALKAGERMVPKSSRRPRQISVPSWLKFKLVKLCSSLFTIQYGDQKGLTRRVSR